MMISPLKRWEGTFVGTMFDEKRSFFYDFSEFGLVVNSWFEWIQDGWRLQELADNEFRLFSRDFPPDFGRRYSIFYNRAELGVLEVTSVSDYSREKLVVSVAIELHSVRLLDLTTVRSLLQGIATHVSDFSTRRRRAGGRVSGDPAGDTAGSLEGPARLPVSRRTERNRLG